MHLLDLDLSLGELSKVEGAAALDLKVRAGKVEEVHFKITEYKRFFTHAIEGKPIIAVPQLLARICGTCSNAHLTCSIQACEQALGIEPSPQTKILRTLTMNGLMLRDHALHLYLFVLPDMFGVDAFLDLDENDPVQHQILHDAFEIKAAGNFLSILVSGRSVHAMYPVIGGFIKVPDAAGAAQAIEKLAAIRPAVLRTIELFAKAPFHFDRKTHFMALIPDSGYGFLSGKIKNDRQGELVAPAEYRQHLEQVVLPYSQASAYTYEGASYMVGALARVNLNKENLHPRTKESAAAVLARFPSTDIYDNNLAQAIELLHCLDESMDLLTKTKFTAEKPAPLPKKAGEGVGVIEAPRGTLYHKLAVDEKGVVKQGEIVVPTGQNQVNIEQDVGRLVEGLLPDASKEQIAHEIEKLIRAYDPCMSCGAHFLKLNWDESKKTGACPV